MMNHWIVGSFFVCSLFVFAEAFTTPSLQSRIQSTRPVPLPSPVSLNAAGGKKRKRRRKRKDQASAVVDEVKTSQPRKVEAVEQVEQPAEEITEEELGQIADVAKFEFDKGGADEKSTQGEGVFVQPDDSIQKGIQNEEITSTVSQTDGAIPLPDIREALEKKKEKEEQARLEEQKELDKVKIKRSDKEAFKKLLEQQPYADADDSLFEKEEYGTVSALLAEGSKPFLGIPSGPLQVGHFIGALGIMLMAFVEYPGFPLTNLPTPLRDCLQGGLFTVYLINTVLAVFAVFKAGERGQPTFLWAAKTFSVGGLAFDQLTQLPTLEQIERAKARKGRFAPKRK